MGNHPIWLISWLEGTRISQSKIEASHVCVATFDLYIHMLLLSLSFYLACERLRREPNLAEAATSIASIISTHRHAVLIIMMTSERAS